VTAPAIDTREAQAERVAAYLERHPEGATLAELDTACDLGSRTKVLSAMARELGYGIARGPARRVLCVNGTRMRWVHTYRMTHRPARPVQLSLSIE